MNLIGKHATDCISVCFSMKNYVRVRVCTRACAFYSHTAAVLDCNAFNVFVYTLDIKQCLCVVYARNNIMEYIRIRIEIVHGMHINRT